MGLVISCDCTPLLHEDASSPVCEHTVALVRYTLQQDACARHPSFEPNEEVMLCPKNLLAMCQNFRVHTEVDLFASHRQHQLPRYYSVDPNEQCAEGFNALNFLWTPSWIRSYKMAHGCCSSHLVALRNTGTGSSGSFDWSEGT